MLSIRFSKQSIIHSQLESGGKNSGNPGDWIVPERPEMIPPHSVGGGVVSGGLVEPFEEFSTRQKLGFRYWLYIVAKSALEQQVHLSVVVWNEFLNDSQVFLIIVFIPIKMLVEKFLKCYKAILYVFY